MKNKGFTLIELLAVIVILAIIALIATPMILGVIDTAKQGSAKSAALGYADAVEKQIMINQLDNDATNDITNDEYTVAELTAKGVTVKGDVPTGNVTIANNKVSSATLTFAKIYDKSVTVDANGTATVAS